LDSEFLRNSERHICLFGADLVPTRQNKETALSKSSSPAIRDNSLPMKDMLHLVASSAALAAIICSSLAVLVDFWIRRHSTRQEKMLLESLASVRKLLSQSRKTELNDAQKEKLWSDVMTYVMNARSSRQAHENVKEAALLLGPKGEMFRQLSEEVLDQRFSNRLSSSARPALTDCTGETA
jgi:hypothetical protein